MLIRLLILINRMYSRIMEHIPVALIQKIIFIQAINKKIQLDSPIF